MSKDVDVEKEIERISRRTRANILKSEISFENQLKQVDFDINKALSRKNKMFDDSKDLTSKHILTDYTDSSLERYRKKLKKI